MRTEGVKNLFFFSIVIFVLKAAMHGYQNESLQVFFVKFLTLSLLPPKKNADFFPLLRPILSSACFGRWFEPGRLLWGFWGGWGCCLSLSTGALKSGTGKTKDGLFFGKWIRDVQYSLENIVKKTLTKSLGPWKAQKLREGFGSWCRCRASVIHMVIVSVRGRSDPRPFSVCPGTAGEEGERGSKERGKLLFVCLSFLVSVLPPVAAFPLPLELRRT